ncbi:MAG: hypothetical protein M3082_06630 [Candidatus Dormibacteraeota bacterium]|nr:hypothetical protein [Candidatus Dormibacteraeota bacterium]
MTRQSVPHAVIVAILVIGCGGRPAAPTRGVEITPPPPAVTAAPGATRVPPATPPPATGTISVWTIPQGDDEVPIKAYEKAFERQNPAADVRIVVVPEDGYTPKVQTAFAGR